MENWVSVRPDEVSENPFKLVGEKWMLITAGDKDRVNTMTASWGGFGVIWNKNVVFVFIRHSRYTKEFVDKNDTFSLTFLNHTRYQKELSYLGTVSGRDEDKIAKTGLTLEFKEETPFFQEGELVMICKKLNKQPMEPERFLASEIETRHYPDQDYHDMYIGEIQYIMKKSE